MDGIVKREGADGVDLEVASTGGRQQLRAVAPPAGRQRSPKPTVVPYMTRTLSQAPWAQPSA
jgi:hypothetical protein